MSIFADQVQGAVAMNQTDFNKVSEDVLIPLFSEVYNYRKLRNLNTTEGANFPAIDLADDVAGVGIQVTSEKKLEKVKETLRIFIEHGLYQKYGRLIIYVLTEKQRSYSRDACSKVVQGRFDFDPDRDILDKHDVLKEVGGLPLDRTRKIQEILELHFGIGTPLRTDFRHFPIALVDQSINIRVERLRKARFLNGFDGMGYARTLARKLLDGEYIGGTDSVRSCALAWCARIHSVGGELDKADELLGTATSLGGDTRVARALVISQKGDKSAALKILAGVESPDFFTAFFVIILKHDGPQAAIDWLKTAGLGVTNLDDDGRFLFIKSLLELGKWEVALETAKTLRESDLADSPVLNYTIGMSLLLSAVPTASRRVVLNHVPLSGAEFLLTSNATALRARKEAQRYFLSAAEAARNFNCFDAAAESDQYALWLELCDPNNAEKGKRRLEERLGGPKPPLYLIPLGLQFGIKLELAEVEKEIERQIALHGEVTRDAAAAHLALSLSQKTPENVGKYIHRHYKAFSEVLDARDLQMLQIEMFAKSGLIAKAKERLDVLSSQGLPELDKKRLRTAIVNAEGRDTVEDRIALFKQSKSLNDLIVLVGELESKGFWDLLCEYAEILFCKASTVQNAERLTNALINANRFDRVVALLEVNTDILEQSAVLRMNYCWALYFEGDLLKARSKLENLGLDSENYNYRTLLVNIAITLGDWNSLSAYVASEHQAKANRSAHDLIRAAMLSLYLGLSYDKQLITAAATKGNDDADVLAAAYYLATKAGWEKDAKVFSWLHRAVELSGDDGPLLEVTLKEVFNLRPEWIRHQADTLQMLSRGDIPMFFAVHSLNRSLVNLMLFPALANSLEDDPRRRIGIPAYSGNPAATIPHTSGTVGVDATVLLTLGFLGLLEEALDFFDTVYLPHSTLSWLFEEKQRASFHQPSRIRDAHQIRHLLAIGVLEKLISSTTANSELAVQVGNDLALLIEEAERTRDDGVQRIVVRTSPVHKMSTLLEEEADLAAHAGVLSSCFSVVSKLRQKGRITRQEEKKAADYLHRLERPWPQQPEILDGAVLYLDDLTVYYLLHLGILPQLKAAGFGLIVSSGLITEVDALIAFEHVSGEVNDAIEQVRSAVHRRIESGRIRVGRWRNSDELQEWSISAHPTMGLLELAEDCDAIVADDRFLNQHPHFENDGIRTSIYTTLDLLDAMESASSIRTADRLEYRAQLLQAGYLLVPINERELAHHLNTAPVADGKISETAELKALRESILLVRMSDWLQLPKEDVWLNSIFYVFVSVLRDLWKPDADTSCVKARSDWILDQLDIRGWAHCFGVEDRDNIAMAGRGGILLMLLTPIPDVPLYTLESYWNWIEDRVIAPIREQNSVLYSWIVGQKKRQILELADAEMTEEQQNVE